MPDASAPMNGKVVMITGPTSGIGKVTALALAGMGAELVLVSRSQDRLRSLCQEIMDRTGNDRALSVPCDLSSMNDVRRLAQEFKDRHHRLDVLVNNAGAILGDRKLSVDGYEYTLALDHLAPFLLTNLLLGELKNAAPSRVVTVSSTGHRAGRIHFDDLMLERGWTTLKAYGQAKLANVLFTYELDRHLEGTGVTANCLHPGMVRNGFGSELRGPMRLLSAVMMPFTISEEDGARTSIYLASAPEVEGVSGRYFVQRRASGSSRRSYDMDVAKRLWEASEKLTGLRS
jgi:NAD(P)-dependent dehydrogenase (short-subunit alcohol dehydrogenase family)